MKCGADIPVSHRMNGINLSSKAITISVCWHSQHFFMCFVLISKCNMVTMGNIFCFLLRCHVMSKQNIIQTPNLLNTRKVQSPFYPQMDEGTSLDSLYIKKRDSRILLCWKLWITGPAHFHCPTLLSVSTNGIKTLKSWFRSNSLIHEAPGLQCPKRFHCWHFGMHFKLIWLGLQAGNISSQQKEKCKCDTCRIQTMWNTQRKKMTAGGWRNVKKLHPECKWLCLPCMSLYPAC